MLRDRLMRQAICDAGIASSYRCFSEGDPDCLGVRSRHCRGISDREPSAVVRHNSVVDSLVDTGGDFSSFRQGKSLKTISLPSTVRFRSRSRPEVQAVLRTKWLDGIIAGI
jgi:hypothetical protein